MSTATIVAGFIISSVGFGVFLFGKRQKRVPPLVAGMLLMALPFVVTHSVWMTVIAAALVFGLRVAIRYQ